MKKYSNIPLKERRRNANKMYRHENRLEEINEKRAAKEKELDEKEYFKQKCRLFEQLQEDNKTDKERQFDEVYSELIGEESEAEK